MIVIILCLFFFYSNNSYANNIANNILANNRNNNKSNNDVVKKINSKITMFDKTYYDDFDSFMFSDKNIQTLQKALTMFKNKGGITEAVENIKKDANEIQPSEEYDINIGNIYLKAIFFISDDNWAVWINDKKISNINNLNDDNEYVIKSLNNNEANIILTVNRMKWNYMNSNAAISSKDFTFNEDKNKIEFEIKLHPNQTFISSKNTVVDGKYRGNKNETEKTNNSTNNKESNSTIFGEEFDFDNL